MSTPPSPPARRRGQLIPLAAIVLVIFGFLAFSYMAHSNTTTSITGKVIYGMKAQQLALALAEETKLLLHEQFNDLDGGLPPWKRELVQLLEGQPDGTAVEIVKDNILPDLPEARTMVLSADGEVLEASLRLHGFHRLNYASTDAYDSPETIYANDDVFKDSTDAKDPRKVLPPEDWVGFATVVARVRVRGTERQVQITHDLKLVDVTPMGREFAWMEWFGLTSANVAAGLNYSSLNGGGKMYIFPNDVGRIFVRGPYTVLLEGRTDGAGGEKRSGSMERNLSYPAGGSKWDGWSAIPSLRALLYNEFAWPGGKNIRPKKDGNSFVIALRIPTINGITLVANDKAVDCASGKYFCGITPVDTQAFSIWGDPQRDKFSMFRGAKARYDSNGNLQSAAEFRAGADLGAGGDGEGVAIEPEGFGLWGVYKTASFDNSKGGIGTCIYLTVCGIAPCIATNPVLILCFPTPGCLAGGVITLDAPPDVLPANAAQAASGGDYQAGPYGLRYMKKEKVPFWAGLINLAIRFAVSYATGSIFPDGGGAGYFGEGTVFGAWGDVSAQTLGNALDYTSQIVTDSMIVNGTSSLLSPSLGNATMPTAQSIAAQIPNGYFPPKFRPFMRGATRIHPNLEEAVDDQGVLNNDGIIMIEAFRQDAAADFKYRGRGMIFSATTGDDANKSPILGNISPVDERQDYLTFGHFVQRPPPADGGDCQVRLNSNDARYSLYTEEGISTIGNSSLVGNLVTRQINKNRIPAGEQFTLLYDNERLGNSDFGGVNPDTQWIDETWKRVSVSPKVSGYYDRFR